MKRMVTTNGRAVIFDGETPIFTLEVKNDHSGKKFVEVQPCAQGLHLGMWLQPAMNKCSETECVEEAPFPCLQAHLIEWACVQELMFLFISVIHASNSKRVRNTAVVELEQKLEQAPSYARHTFEDIVLETEPPQGMSTRDIKLTGLSAALMEKFVAKFGHQPPEQTL